MVHSHCSFSSTRPGAASPASDDESAGFYKERGIEAIAFKNHVVTTADRA
jgi:hypothetical protein